MTSWIFQANPDTYDLDGFLASRIPTMLFTVSRQSTQMQPGDQVFIWRAQGRRNALPGVIAEATIIAAPKDQPDDPAAFPFWTKPGMANDSRMRVELRINKVANKKEVLQKNWLGGDPILKELYILKMSNATNYLLAEDQSKRLNKLWNKNGTKFTRDDCIAALWAFHQTYEKPIIKSSLIADVALQIGRTCYAVYNKVTNYRSLGRGGTTSGGTQTKRVWKEFYLPGQRCLDEQALENEYRRLWIEPAHTPNVADASVLAYEEISEANELAKTKSLSELMALLASKRTKNNANVKPSKKIVLTSVYVREPLLVAICKKQANHCCEVPNCKHPTFITNDDLRYCEVHHIIPLSEGGSDDLGNIICLCPAHHIEAHRGRNSADLKIIFIEIRKCSPLYPQLIQPADNA